MLSAKNEAAMSTEAWLSWTSLYLACHIEYHPKTTAHLC